MTKRHRAGTPKGGRFAPTDRSDADVSLDADSDDLPRHIIECLPPATASAWRKVVDIVPLSAVLAGGTGLAAHIGHRTSEDLDFMMMDDEDLDALVERLEQVGTLAVTVHTDDTLNCYLDRAKLQFLRAHGQRALRPTISIGGLEVASVEDIAAMKLAAVDGRGQIRDYFDLMELDRRELVRTEEALHHFVQRYGDEPATRQAVPRIVMALGHFGDVQDDPGLLVSKPEIERYWRRRQPQIARSIGTRW